MSEIDTRLDPLGSRPVAVKSADLQSQNSAVSWAAIFAGAAGAAVLSLLLLILGTGLGLSAVSPWTMEGISVTTFGFATVAWLIVTQLAASGMGGYLTGRLRTKWTAVRADEVFFRDTAHGFLSWAVAALLTLGVLTSVVGSVVSGGVRAGAAMAGGVVSAAGTVSGATGAGQLGNSVEYFVDALFRPRPNGGSEGNTQVNAQQYQADPSTQQLRESSREFSVIPTAEMVRIFSHALQTGILPEGDERYVAQLIAQRTGMSQQDAEQQVSSGFENFKTTLENMETASRDAVDKARAASAYAALWLFVSLLIGAFFASLMAVCGGRQRDA